MKGEKMKSIINYLFAITLFLIAVSHCMAFSIPKQLSYQGKLFKNDIPVNGIKTITFRIGNWTESQEVNIVNGLYSVSLGEKTPIPISIFDNQEQVELTITIDNTALSPKTVLLSVPYAYISQRSSNADQLDDQAASFYLNWKNFTNIPDSLSEKNFKQWSEAYTHSLDEENPHKINKAQIGLEDVPNIDFRDSWSQNSDQYIATDRIQAIRNSNGLQLFDYSGKGITVKNSGKVGIDVPNPEERLEVSGNIKAQAFYDLDDVSYYLNPNSTNHSLLVAGKVGIGTKSPNFKLDIAGDINFSGNLYQNGVQFFFKDDDWSMNGSNIYKESGQVGIGTYSPKEKLDVAGNICLNSTLFFKGNDSNIRIFRSSRNLHIEAPDGDIRMDFGTLCVDSVNDRVGIGTTSPNLKFKVQGQAGGTTAWYNESDKRLKTDIVTISDALDKVNQLRGVEYTKIDSTQRRIGFIAQEAIKVVPQVVEQNDEYLHMQYAPLTALLVEAIKELTSENQKLKQDIAFIKNQLMKNL
jgi:hypothetical protein